MLEELGRTITRLESYSLSTSPPLHTLKVQHERFAVVLERICLCTAPKIVRILTEEALEAAEWILHLPTSDTKTVYIGNTPEWERYVKAVSDGYILDTEYRRFLKANDFADRLLEHSYLYECKQREYKAMRYEYALSPGEAPSWFQTEKAALWVEEIVTAYCFLVFSVLDFAEEYGLAS